jgi:hypothetical protein
MISREERRRSPSFLEGTKVLLADGNTWMLPVASALLARGVPAQASEELGSLVDAIQCSEGAEDLGTSELALAIFLLTWNYEFEEGELAAILTFPSGGPLRESSQQAFHDVAAEYVQQLRVPPRSLQEML